MDGLSGVMVGIGTDIQPVREFACATALQESGLFFSPDELRHAQNAAAGVAASLSGLFAAKEAFFKALPKRVHFFWTDAEIRHTSAGAPHFQFHGALDHFMSQRGWRALLSISHGGDYATAFVVVAN